MRRAVTLGVAFALLVGGCGAVSITPTAGVPSSTAAQPTPTPTPLPSESPSPPQAWGYAGGDDALSDRLGDPSLEAIATHRGQFVVVGSGPHGAVSSVSLDGTSWTRSGEVPSSAGYAEMLHVVSDGNALVASGRDWSFGDTTWVATGAELWASEDGRTWESVARLPGDEITGLAALGRRLVAVGLHLGSTDEAAFWSSADGHGWQPATIVARTVSTPPDTQAHVTSVAASGDFLVAVGSSVWISADGDTWTEGPLPPGVVEGSDIAVAQDTFFFLGAGSDGSDRWHLWSSRDGRSWTSTASIPSDEVLVSGLADANGVLFELGSVCTGECDPAVWTSVEGATWVGPVLLQGAGPSGNGVMNPGFIRAIAALGSRYVAVGSRVWVSQPSSGPAPTPSPTPSGCPAGDPDLATLALMEPSRAVECFGRRSITISGYRYEGECGCGVGLPRAPEWLADAFAGRWIQALSGPGRSRVLIVRMDPATGIPEELPGNVPLVLTGHFDDPAAKTCRSLDGSESRDALVAMCRGEFVVTDLHVGSTS